VRVCVGERARAQQRIQSERERERERESAREETRLRLQGLLGFSGRAQRNSGEESRLQRHKQPPVRTFTRLGSGEWLRGRLIK
jgi:hypothetical protein